MDVREPYDNNQPIYLQIMDRVRRKIVAGEWRAGDRVPPVRDLALEFGGNPNTMQRSLAELEREGLLFSERTSGRYVTRDEDRITAVRDEMARGEVAAFRKRMVQMGYSDGEVRRLLERAFAPEGEAVFGLAGEGIKETTPERCLEGKDDETDERVTGDSAFDQSV